MRAFLFFFCCCLLQCAAPTKEVLRVKVVVPTALRETPGEAGRELTTLRTGEILDDLGMVSDFETTLEMRQTRTQTPWIKVQTASSQVGWIPATFAAPVPERGDWFFQKKLQCYFGPHLSARRNALVAAKAPASEADFAVQYRETLALRDTFAQLLRYRVERSQASSPADWQWLQELLPGLSVQQLPGDPAPNLWFDWRFWLQKSLKTTGLQDNRFVETCLTAFPIDSIESALPAWVFPIDVARSHSNLGQGFHFKMLTQVAQVLKSDTLFRPELLALKTRTLEDVFDNNRTYWQPREKILAELKKIADAPLSCLSDQDRLALGVRLRMFEEMDGNEIRVNLRAGN